MKLLEEVKTRGQGKATLLNFKKCTININAFNHDETYQVLCCINKRTSKCLHILQYIYASRPLVKTENALDLSHLN